MTRAMMTMIMMTMVVVMTMMIDLFHGHDGFVLLQVSRAGHLATRRDGCYYFVSTYCMQSDAIHRP